MRRRPGAHLAVKVRTDSTAGLEVTSTAPSVLVNGADVAGVVSGRSWQLDCPIPFVGNAIAKDVPIPIVLTTATDTAEVLACVQQPANWVDTAACGDAFHVLPCWKQLHP